MNGRLWRACYLGLITLSLHGPAMAQGASSWRSDLLAVGVGGTDILEDGKRAAADFRLEYRAYSLGYTVARPNFTLLPWAGLETTTRGAVWGGGGIMLDIPIGPVSLLPLAGVGAYGQGNGKALGSPLEFRVGAELAYRFAGGSRVSAMFSHASNAGVAKHNPGTEAVMIYYQLPLGALLPGTR